MRNLLTFQPIGIAGSIPALVMRTDDGRDGIGKGDALQNFSADLSVDLDFLEFFGRKRSGLVDDVFGNRQLADVVQQSGSAQRFDLLFGETQFFGDLNREHAHALQMFVRSVVLGFNGQRQGFDGAQVQRRNFFGVALFYFDLPLFRGQLGEIEVIGAVDPVDQRQNQKGSLPSHALAQVADTKHDCGADHVEGERPEVAFRPDLVRGLAFGQLK